MTNKIKKQTTTNSQKDTLPVNAFQKQNNNPPLRQETAIAGKAKKGGAL